MELPPKVFNGHVFIFDFSNIALIGFLYYWTGKDTGPQRGDPDPWQENIST